jgi:hypothetical protein
MACAGLNTPDKKHTSWNMPTESPANLSDTPRMPDLPMKSPHGYIISKGYRPDKYGGFIGNCASDENFPYYWDCQSENAGDNLN